MGWDGLALNLNDRLALGLSRIGIGRLTASHPQLQNTGPPLRE